MSGWNVLAWTLGVLGGVGVLVAWFQDQSRGRRRCPRCWYSMASVPGLQCPECGRTAKHEGRLWKTRRRKGLAALFAVLCASGFATHWAAKSAKAGWPTVAPAWFLAMNYAALDDWGQAWVKEVDDRRGRGEFSAGELSQLVDAAASVALHPATTPADQARAADFIATVTDGAVGFSTRLADIPAARAADLLARDASRFVRVAARALRTDTASRKAGQRFAWHILDRRPELAADLAGDIAATLSDGNGVDHSATLNMLRRPSGIGLTMLARDEMFPCTPCAGFAGLNRAQTFDRALTLVEDPAPSARAVALLAASLADPARFAASTLAETALADADPFVQTAAVAAQLTAVRITAAGDTAGRNAIIRTHLASSDTDVRAAALRWTERFMFREEPIPADLVEPVAAAICLPGKGHDWRDAVGFGVQFLNLAGATLEQVRPIAMPMITREWPDGDLFRIDVILELPGESDDIARWLAEALAAEHDPERLDFLFSWTRERFTTPALINALAEKAALPQVHDDLMLAVAVLEALASHGPAAAAALPVIRTYTSHAEPDVQAAATKAIAALTTPTPTPPPEATNPAP